MVDGPATLDLSWQRSPRTEAGGSPSASSSEGGLRSEYKPEFFPRTFASTHGRRMSQWLLPSARHVSQPVVTVVFVQRGVFSFFLSDD